MKLTAADPERSRSLFPSERVPFACHRRAGQGTGSHAAFALPVEHFGAQGHRGSGIYRVRRPRRRHLRRHRPHARAPESAGHRGLGARLRKDAGVAEDSNVPEGSDWKIATQLAPHPDGTWTAPNMDRMMDSPRRNQPSLPGRMEGGRFAVPHGAAPPRHRRRGRRLRPHVPGGRRPRKRASSARFPSTTTATTPSCWTTCPTSTATAWSIATPPSITGARDLRTGAAQMHRHRGARVLPLLERQAHPSQDARALRFRARRHVRRVVVRRRLHQLLRPADAEARGPDATSTASRAAWAAPSAAC